mgnify:FL=1
MAFFRRKRKGTINTNVEVADIYVVTSMIISNHNDGTGVGPRCVTMYFLAKCEEGEYYELFSGKRLEKEKQPEDGFLAQTFNTPYVEKAEPLTKYLKNPQKVIIDIQSLFDFILQMNVLGELGAFSEEDDEVIS